MGSTLQLTQMKCTCDRLLEEVFLMSYKFHRGNVPVIDFRKSLCSVLQLSQRKGFGDRILEEVFVVPYNFHRGRNSWNGNWCKWKAHSLQKCPMCFYGQNKFQCNCNNDSLPTYIMYCSGKQIIVVHRLSCFWLNQIELFPLIRMWLKLG